MKKSDYRSNETTVFCCRYHVIFCSKYRRKVLIHGIDERFKEIVLSMQEEQNFKVLEMEVMPDHVHLLLDVDPTIGVNTLVGQSKERQHIFCAASIQRSEGVFLPYGREANLSQRLDLFLSTW